PTAFVWLQHHGSLQALARSENTALARTWLPELCAGRRRGGLALSGQRPGPHQLRARRVPGGVLLDGECPWVPGWSPADVPLPPAPAKPQPSRLLADARDTDTLIATPVPLVAANASRNVRLRFHSHFVPSERIVAVLPYAELPAHDGGGRTNGS